MSTVGNDKLLFLHVPKTGGEWVTEAMRAAGVRLGEEGPKHAELPDIERNGRFTFAFVREPVSWYRAWWKFAQLRERLIKSVADNDNPNRFLSLDFLAFIKASIECYPGWLSSWYCKFVGPPDSPIDFVGRYENLVDDLVTALRFVGQDFNEKALRALPPVNCSGLPPDCPESIRERLRASERAAYERFYAPVLA